MVNDPNNNPEDLSYQVMPQPGNRRIEPPQHDNSPPPSVDKNPPPQHPLDPGVTHEYSNGFGRNRIVYIVVGIVVLVVLAALVYFLVGSKTNEEPMAQQLPKTWLTKYFNKEVCDDVSVCGDEADPDNDGLTNFEEFKKTGTSLTSADTDGDGIADGDEFNIYKTDPTDKFTDTRQIASTNNFTDGHQIKNGYDPLTPGIKFTETRLQQIATDREKFGLHEPTITTLGSAEPTAETPAAKTVTVNIEGNKFTPQAVVINKGDTVIWINKDTAKHQVASDPHPTHTILPALESTDLSQNQTFSLKFDTAGTFGYHDHLDPQIKGTVEVK